MDTKTSVSGSSDDVDISTNCSTILTPSASTVDFKEFDNPIESSIPYPGKIFMLRDNETGKVLTLLDGDVSLQPPGTRGSAYHWICEEHNGWLGFKNVASGTYLGHNFWGNIYAAASRHNLWENFCVRIQPNGGFVLLMMQAFTLWPVKKRTEGGQQRLFKTEAPVKDGNIWNFIEV